MLSWLHDRHETQYSSSPRPGSHWDVKFGLERCRRRSDTARPVCLFIYAPQPYIRAFHTAIRQRLAQVGTIPFSAARPASTVSPHCGATSCPCLQGSQALSLWSARLPSTLTTTTTTLGFWSLFFPSPSFASLSSCLLVITTRAAMRVTLLHPYPPT